MSEVRMKLDWKFVSFCQWTILERYLFNWYFYSSCILKLIKCNVNNPMHINTSHEPFPRSIIIAYGDKNHHAALPLATYQVIVFINQRMQNSDNYWIKECDLQNKVNKSNVHNETSGLSINFNHNGSFVNLLITAW